MGFWEEHAEAEAALAPPPPPSAQNAPMRCGICGEVSTSVLFGSCIECEERHG